MVRVKTPINTEEVKKRAARKLSRLNANPASNRANGVLITGHMVKPVHVSKTDPLVKRITNYQKIN